MEINMTLKCVNGIKNGTNKVSMGYRKCQWYHRVAIITEEDTVRYGTVRYGTVRYGEVSMEPKRRNWYVLFTETGFSPDILNRFGQPQLRSIRCHQEANGTNKVSMLP